MENKPFKPEDRRPRFTAAAETNQIVELLGKVAPGDPPTTYEVLSRLVGREIRQHRYWLYTALKILRRAPHCMEFAAVTGVGVVRIVNEEICEKEKAGISRMHNRCRTSAKALGNVVVEHLTPEGRNTFYAAMSHIAVLAVMTQAKAQRQLHNAVQGTQQQLPMDATLALFLSKKPAA